jgi:hypothetical protein
MCQIRGDSTVGPYCCGRKVQEVSRCPQQRNRVELPVPCQAILRLRVTGIGNAHRENSVGSMMPIEQYQANVDLRTWVVRADV